MTKKTQRKILNLSNKYKMQIKVGILYFSLLS